MDIINEIIKLENENKPIILVSEKIPSITIEEAYKMQKDITDKKESLGIKVGGYKAAFTGKTMQEKFNISEPVSGSMFEIGFIKDNVIKTMPNVNIETEIAYTMKEDIDYEIKSIDELKPLIKSANIGIEVPHMNFEHNNTGMKASDFIVTNISSYKYMVGDALDLNTLNETEIKLYKDNEFLFNGIGNEIGDQMESLRWLINDLVKHNNTVKKDCPLFTGSLGKLIPASKGNYKVTYNENKEINFKVI